MPCFGSFLAAPKFLLLSSSFKHHGQRKERNDDGGAIQYRYEHFERAFGGYFGRL